MSEPPALRRGRLVDVVLLELSRLRHGARLKVALGLIGVLGLGIAAAYHSAPAPSAVASDGGAEVAAALALVERWKSVTEFAVFSLLAFVLPFMFGTVLIAEEVSSRTLPFVFSKPLSRPTVLLGKYLAAAALAVPLLLAAAALFFVITLAATGEADGASALLLLRTLAAAALLGAYYTAICLLWSAALPGEANIAAAVHLAVFEFALGKAPGFLRFASGNRLARMLAGLDMGDDATGLAGWPAWMPYAAAGGILALAALTLGAALLAGHTREYRMGDVR